MEASITLDFSPYSENIIDILKAFQKIGWNIYNPKNEVEYIPNGDSGMYNWLCEKMPENKFYDIISNKISKNEQVAINLFYNSGDEGITFIANDTDRILLSIDINRHTLIDQRHTDMVWYLNNIIYKFLDADVKLLSYSLSEYDD